jgi:hypothetical protein
MAENSLHYKPNGSFSKTLPYLQLFWDSTSLGALKTCPRYYQYAIIQGYQSFHQSIHLTFGLLYHSTLEYYDHMKFSGMDHETALHATVRKVLIDTWDTTLNRPVEMDSDSKSRSGLIRTIIWYLDQFKDDTLETVRLDNGKPAIELSFRLESGYMSITNEPYFICGHFDKYAKMDDKYFIVDRKTTKNTLNSAFFEKFKLDNQMNTYDFSGNIALPHGISGIIIDGAQIAVTFSRFARQQIYKPKSIIDEWYRDFGIYLSMAESYAKAEYWPMNLKACQVPRIDDKTGEMVYGCTFAQVCMKPESLRQQFLSAGYSRRTWDPTVVRGDI